MKVPDSPEVRQCRMALLNAIRPYADVLGTEGMLAVAAAFVGQLIAFQDQRTMTPERAIEIVRRNIENANQEVADRLRNAMGGSA